MSSQGAKSGRSLLVAFLGFAAGATVANIYYSQPLLHAISTHFHSSAALTSIISVATQLGYGSGLLVFVPLGDSVERRTLIVGSIIGTALILLSTAFSATLPFLILVSYLLGLICITPQLIVPYAAGIAEPKARGRTVGIVMSGLVIGILFSRSVSGFIGARAGWQAVYFIAAGGMLLLALMSALVLPAQRPERHIPYRELLASIWPILSRQPVVQRHAIIGALGLGGFSAFWTTWPFISLTGRNISIVKLPGKENMNSEVIEQNKALYRQFLQQVFNEGKLEMVDELLSPDYVLHDPQPGTPPGREAVKHIATTFRNGLPDLTIAIDDLVAVGDKVCVRATTRRNS